MCAQKVLTVSCCVMSVTTRAPSHGHHQHHKCTPCADMASISPAYNTRGWCLVLHCLPCLLRRCTCLIAWHVDLWASISTKRSVRKEGLMGRKQAQWSWGTLHCGQGRPRVTLHSARLAVPVARSPCVSLAHTWHSGLCRLNRAQCQEGPLDTVVIRALATPTRLI